MLNACRLIYRRAITATRVKGVLPATDAVASSCRETRVVGTRTEKLRQSAEIVFHVGRRTRGTVIARRETGWPPRNARRRPLAAAAAPSNFPIGATPIYLRRCLMARSTTRILSLRPDEIIGTFVTPVTTDSLSSPSERSDKSNGVPAINARRGLRRVETQVPSRLAFVFVLRPIVSTLYGRRRVRVGRVDQPARRFHKFPKFQLSIERRRWRTKGRDAFSQGWSRS